MPYLIKKPASQATPGPFTQIERKPSGARLVASISIIHNYGISRTGHGGYEDIPHFGNFDSPL
jgi:hypothetical protein